MLAKLGRTLLLDLLIPWTISAVCIIVLMKAMMHFGLFWGAIGWLAAFGAFLAVCVLKQV